MKKLLIVFVIMGFAGFIQAQDSEPIRSSFNINPLGLLQFGPIFQYEAPVSQKVCISPYFRYAYAGLLTHLTWTAFDEDDELSPGSLAFGFGAKGFVNGEGNSMYYGAFLDFGRTKVNWSVGYSDETEEVATTLAVVPNFGYRWRTSGSVHFNLGIYSGLAFTLNDEERYVSDNELFATYNNTEFFAMLEFSIGWEK